MSQQELLKYAIIVLEAAKIPYMVTGSTVSSLKGQPRSTHDVGIVIGIHPSASPALRSAFQLRKFCLDESAVRDAVAGSFSFNAIDCEGGDKIDFWILKSDAFEQSSFRRRYQASAAGTLMYVLQPEDTILNKLRWAKDLGGSEKQVKDCIAVYEINYTTLDHDYLKGWARELGVADQLARVHREANL